MTVCYAGSPGQSNSYVCVSEKKNEIKMYINKKYCFEIRLICVDKNRPSNMDDAMKATIKLIPTTAIHTMHCACIENWYLPLLK